MVRILKIIRFRKIRLIFDFISTDSNKLAEILMQRPIDMKRPGFATRLSDKDIAHMQADAKRHFDVVLDTLKQMPRNMLFVVRRVGEIK